MGPQEESADNRIGGIETWSAMQVRMTENGLEWHCDYCDGWKPHVFLIVNSHGRLACCMCRSYAESQAAPTTTRELCELSRATVEESRRAREQRQRQRRL